MKHVRIPMETLIIYCVCEESPLKVVEADVVAAEVDGCTIGINITRLIEPLGIQDKLDALALAACNFNNERQLQ